MEQDSSDDDGGRIFNYRFCIIRMSHLQIQPHEMKTIVVRCLCEERPQVRSILSDVVSSIVYERRDVAWSVGAGRGEALLTHPPSRGRGVRSCSPDCLYDGRMMFGQPPPVALKTLRGKEARGGGSGGHADMPSLLHVSGRGRGCWGSSNRPGKGRGGGAGTGQETQEARQHRIKKKKIQNSDEGREGER